MYLQRKGSGCERHLRTQLGWDLLKEGRQRVWGHLTLLPLRLLMVSVSSPSSGVQMTEVGRGNSGWRVQEEKGELEKQGTFQGRCAKEVAHCWPTDIPGPGLIAQLIHLFPAGLSLPLHADPSATGSTLGSKLVLFLLVKNHCYVFLRGIWNACDKNQK